MFRNISAECNYDAIQAYERRCHKFHVRLKASGGIRHRCSCSWHGIHAHSIEIVFQVTWRNVGDLCGASAISIARNHHGAHRNVFDEVRSVEGSVYL